MKKSIILILLFLGVSFTVFSQGFYIDIGLGAGYFSQSIAGHNIGQKLNENYRGSEIDYIPLNIGISANLRSGFGPFETLPLFLVGDFFATWSIIGALTYDKETTNKEDVWLPSFENYFLGPGAIFYPLSFLQIGASLGFSFFYGTSVFTSGDNYSLVIGGDNFSVSIDNNDIWQGGGFGWHLSIGLNLGRRRHFLISGDYFGSVNRIRQGSTDKTFSAQTSNIGIFLKYVYGAPVTSAR